MRSYKYPVSKPKLGVLEDQYLTAALASKQLTQGPMVATFEEMLEASFGRGNHVVACSSGTSALHLALVAAGVRPGDEVLVPSMTYIATANAVAYTGATPVIVDVSHDSWTIDVEDVLRKMSSKTVAVLPVHLYGVPADMDALEVVCGENGWWLIEDAAEALKSTHWNEQCGTIGDFGCFSFYGNKLITTGEGGCVVTPDDNAAKMLRKLRGQGQSAQRFVHDVLGFNYRMTEMQAAIGVAQLAQLDAFIAARNLVTSAYDEAFKYAYEEGLMYRQHALGPFTRSPWLYTFMLRDKHARDTMMAKLDEQGIETRPTFVPLHRQKNYQRPDAQFPISSKIGDRGISIPTYAEMTVDDARYIANRVLELLKPQQKQNFHLTEAGAKR